MLKFAHHFRIKSRTTYSGIMLNRHFCVMCRPKMGQGYFQSALWSARA